MDPADGEWSSTRPAARCANGSMLARGTWTIAVTISALQFAHSGLVETVRGALARHDVPPCLTLEVTESTAMTCAEASLDCACAGLSGLGVTISIDDFGTGYPGPLEIQRPAGCTELVAIDRRLQANWDNDNQHAGRSPRLSSLGAALTCVTRRGGRDLGAEVSIGPR